MKKHIVVSMIILSLLTTFQVTSFGQDKYVPGSDEELYGTWTNEHNGGDIFHPQKVVITPGGYTAYSMISDTNPLFVWKSWIDSKWTDSEGNIWYKVFGAGTGQ
jgi:hypothetical protein